MEVVTIVDASSKKRGREEDENDNEVEEGGKKKKWNKQDGTLTNPNAFHPWDPICLP